MAFIGDLVSDFLKVPKIEEISKQKYIEYGATDFTTLKESLINYIKAVYPTDYNYFAESDLGMVFIELVAYMGHVLSYKADYLANENFITTARSKNSIQKLLELIGITMHGPVAAACNARLVLQDITTTWNDESRLVISPESRVFTTTSSEDKRPLSLTLYKISKNGDINIDNSNGSISLLNSDMDSNILTNNLVLLEGSLAIETGQFSDTESLKLIRLKNNYIIEGSVKVFIQSQNLSYPEQYKQIHNIFFASGSSDKVFQLVMDNAYGGIIAFGDNIVGKSPTLGDTYTVHYRIGGGTRGNIAERSVSYPIGTTFYATLNSSGTPITGNIVNTSKGTGGIEPETVAHAKNYGPLVYRSQDRLVTIQDYKTFANTYLAPFGSIGKANAVVRRAYSSANIIDLYILEKANDLQLRKATPEFKRQMLLAIQEKKMLTDEIVIVDGLIRTIDLVTTIRLDKIYEIREGLVKSSVTTKILNYFAVDNTDFGKEFNPIDLVHDLFEIPEVRFATLDNIPDIIKVNFNEIIQLNNLTINLVYV